MSFQVVMPSLGESVEEVTLTRWLKAVGEPVEEYEALLEVNTDKVDSEIPSPASGVLAEIRVTEGATVRAGTLLAIIAQHENNGTTTPDQETVLEAPTSQAGTAPVSTAQPALIQGGGMVPAATTAGPGRELGFISPVVARIAAEHGVDLSEVPGTGLDGRITKRDILAYIEGQPQKVATPAPTLSPQPVPAALAPAAAQAPAALPGEVLPLNQVRRAIAEHMVLSKRTSPHATTVMEADLSRVTAHRAAHKEAYARDGANLTYTVYFIAAVVNALKAYPIVNSSWSEEGIRLHRPINIGMAASLGQEGLIVPVIKNADSLSLLGLARTINDLANRARGRKLLPDEVKGGTFTLTNHGTSGSLFAAPIINQPQCAILGAGAIQKRVVVVSDPALGDVIAIRPMVYLSLTFDHRILDGAVADHFLAKVVESLQNFKEPI